MLAELHLHTPPIRVVDVLNAHGILVEPLRHLPTGTARCDGFIMAASHVTKIFINPRMSRLRQRFTVAHELGHYFLHNDLPFRLLAMRSPLVKDDIEVAADAFAACLLMPERVIREEMANCPQFDYLRDRFWISKQAMYRRLGTLGLLSCTGTDKGFYPVPNDWQRADDPWRGYFDEAAGMDAYAHYLELRQKLAVHDAQRGITNSVSGRS